MGWVLLVLGMGVGAYCLSITTYFYWLYFSQPENAARHEYFMGVAVGSMLASPGLVAASIGAIFLKKSVGMAVRSFIFSLTTLVLCIFFYFLIFD